MHARIGQAPAQERFRPRRDTERFEVLGGRRPAKEVAFAIRPHREHTQAEVRGQGQDALLGLALERVPRDLDRDDPAGLHHLGQLAERRRVPVGGAEHPDTAGVTFGLHPWEMLAPGHQVVHLQQIDSTTVEAQLRRELRASLLDRGRPDLGGDDRVAATIAQRATQHSLGASVHRRGVHDPGAGVQGRLDHETDVALLGMGDVEGGPGSQADGGDHHARGAERPPLQGDQLAEGSIGVPASAVLVVVNAGVEGTDSPPALIAITR